jgi:hypothetical protein
MGVDWRKKMTKLYQLTAAYNDVWQMVDDPDVDLLTIEDTLECIEASIEEKSSNIAAFDASLAADEEYLDAEIKRLQQRKKTVSNKRESIKNYLFAQLEAAGIEKVKTPLFTISIVNNPPAVQIVDDKSLPSKFLTIIPAQYQPMKKEIAEAIKSGEEVPGAVLTQGRRLKIS